MASRWPRCTLVGLATGSLLVAARATAESPRTLGRAEAALVASDGSAAVADNPAAIMRRDATRLDLAWSQATARETQSTGDARTASVAAADTNILLGVVWGTTSTAIGFSAAMATDHRALPAPDTSQPTPQIAARYFYRYQPFVTRHSQTRMTVGVAHRVGDYLALGLSAGMTAATMRREQFAWAGRPERDAPLASEYDVALAWEGKSALGGQVALGVMAATDGPWEFAASMRLATGARARAPLSATPISPLVSVAASGARVDLRTTASLQAAAGARWLGSAVSIEANARWHSAQTTTHALSGVTLVDELGSGAIATTMRDRTPMATSLGLSGDWMAVDGMLWLTAGVGVTLADAQPAIPRAGVGLEFVSAPYTVTTGAMITAASRDIRDDVIAPFVSSAVPGPVATAHTLHVATGLSLERAW
ncbi:MAG: hypothetical protein IPL79_01170 [Myxococcales bacterium]|nr:hypothetical protein [Myxococcales bacterium]